MGASDFEWNKGPEAEPDVHQMAEKKALEAGEEGRLSHFLVDLHSALEELHHAYLSAEQRNDLANILKAGFFGLQQIAVKEADEETRHKLTHYLVIIGSIGVQQDGGKLFTFLEALSNDGLFQWCNRFYSATHDIEEQTEEITYTITGFEQEREARRDLMLQLEK